LVDAGTAMKVASLVDAGTAIGVALLVDASTAMDMAAVMDAGTTIEVISTENSPALFSPVLDSGSQSVKAVPGGDGREAHALNATSSCAGSGNAEQTPLLAAPPLPLPQLTPYSQPRTLCFLIWLPLSLALAFAVGIAVGIRCGRDQSPTALGLCAERASTMMRSQIDQPTSSSTWHGPSAPHPSTSRTATYMRKLEAEPESTDYQWQGCGACVHCCHWLRF